MKGAGESLAPVHIRGCMKRYLFPFLFGVVGVAVLVSLGVWQLQRLEWKEAILADIEDRISDAPAALPARPDPETHRYMPVSVQGRFDPAEIHVLVSLRDQGAGYRIIQPFETGGRRILVDRGFVPATEKNAPPATGPAVVTGNLHWPDEVDGFTPEPDVDENIWFARDVPVLAGALDTEPVLVIAREIEGAQRGEPLPVTATGIPNNHLGYAVQWFGLAIVWAGMTAFLLWRIHTRTDEREA